jgi:hypothetical protein
MTDRKLTRRAEADLTEYRQSQQKEQADAMEKVLMHMIAGYRVDFDSFGDDCADGIQIMTENRWTGQYVEARGADIREACVELVKKMGKP